MSLPTVNQSAPNGSTTVNGPATPKPVFDRSKLLAAVQAREGDLKSFKETLNWEPDAGTNVVVQGIPVTYNDGVYKKGKNAGKPFVFMHLPVVVRGGEFNGRTFDGANFDLQQPTSAKRVAGIVKKLTGAYPETLASAITILEAKHPGQFYNAEARANGDYTNIYLTPMATSAGVV